MLSFISSFFSSSDSASSSAPSRLVPTPSSVALDANPYGTSTRPVYSPGMRTLSAASIPAASPSPSVHHTIQLQDFSDGAPPAPPVSLSWARISRWAEKNYPELSDNIGDPTHPSDLAVLERVIDCSLPADVRASFLEHDGQQEGGKPCGLIYGNAMLNTDEVVTTWETWRVIASTLDGNNTLQQQLSDDGLPGPSSRQPPSASASRSATSGIGPQTSVPARAIQPVFACTGWLPLAKDFCGNYIGVDLAPGPAGHWGQVILYGREFDRKYVVARSWGHFLAMLADDFEEGRWSVDEDSEEIWYVSNGRMHSYIDVLKRRVERAVAYSQRKQSKAPAATASSPMSKSLSADSHPSRRSKPAPLSLHAPSAGGRVPGLTSSSESNLLADPTVQQPVSPGVVSARLPRIPKRAAVAGSLPDDKNLTDDSEASTSSTLSTADTTVTVPVKSEEPSTAESSQAEEDVSTPTVEQNKQLATSSE